MTKRCSPLAALIVMIAAVLWRPAAAEAENYTFIRDAEVEHTIRTFATPLFRAAGLVPSAIHIYVVKDHTLNAFVAGGQNLFINTGLLMNSENPDQLIGVIAHETGHILGGHLARSQEALKNMSAESILAMVLGAAIAVGTGRPDIGQAVMMGGQQVGIRTYLGHSRTQESSADNAAMRLLDDTHQSGRGLLNLLKQLEGQELLSPQYQNPYVRTHPLTSERMDFLREHVAKSKYSDTPEPEKFVRMQHRMVAKLYAFLNPLDWVLRKYPESDQSISARYARAIAYYRVPDLKKALPLIDGLIADRPADPYFYELKGQMMFENGRVPEALQAYTEAVKRLPDSALMRISLAQVQLESGKKDLLPQAIDNLQMALNQEQNNPFAWRQLAIAYGRSGETGLSSLALAEEALLKRDIKTAQYQAGSAAKALPHGSPGWLKAQDILQTTNSPQGKPDDR